MAPNLHASMHQLQPLHFSSSTIITPVVGFCIKVSRGQAATHGAFSQKRQAKETSMKGSILVTRIREFSGLKFLFLVAEQTSSHIPQPVHFS